MEFVTGIKKSECCSIEQAASGTLDGQTVRMEGTIHTIRDMGEVAFVILRKAEGLVQCVYEAGKTPCALSDLQDSMSIRVTGTVSKEERAPQGFEIRLAEVEILSRPYETLPLQISKWKLNTSLEAKLNYRSISLRNVKERAKFKIQEAVFEVKYFDRKAYLAQSPQFYKQMMVGVFDRVYEVAPVFRAEKHNTKRHLNEYTSLDFEMGYIRSFEEIMAMETGFLQYTMELLKTEYAREVKLLGIEIPDVSRIPQVRFDEAKRLVSEKYNRTIRNPYDLEPEEEVLIGRYFEEEYGSKFVFVTHYPSKKRPFYAMDDPADPTFTLSFDLLFEGMEITTGGQRIHDYKQLREKIAARKMTEEGMEQYLDTFKYGMPPHGGLGIGLERLTMKLVGEDNVREATLFPRDLSRLTP